MINKKVKYFNTILKPIVTEKSAMSEGEGGKVSFVVKKDASKSEIKSAVEGAFEVEVAKVNTLNMQGKVKRVGRSVGRTKSFKKAMVTLKPGFSIDVVEGV